MRNIALYSVHEYVALSFAENGQSTNKNMLCPFQSSFSVTSVVKLESIEGRAYNRQGHIIGQNYQKCKETSSPLVDKQQKRGEHVVNIKFC